MAQSLLPVGLEVGKYDVDPAGQARYSIKLTASPGTNPGMTPAISLEYFQGAPNGSLGVGWILGGVSSIRKGQSMLARDQHNPAPPGYNRLTPKLNLDGAELLNITGEYFAPGAVYTTEAQTSSSTITTSGTGFVISKPDGSRAEYGLTQDSIRTFPGTNEIREWRLNRRLDYYGNTIVYQYTSDPLAAPNVTSDQQACYLSRITYTGNERTQDPGHRVILFQYASRPDLVVQTTQGVNCTWTARLKGVQMGINRLDGSIFLHRSWALDYQQSQATGDSQLIRVTEQGRGTSQTSALLPTLFQYTEAKTASPNQYQQAPQQQLRTELGTQALAVIPMNVTGRCLADLAVIQYDAQSLTPLSIKTFLAQQDSQARVQWTASTGPYAEVQLPTFDVSSGFPDILTPDISRRGRSDLVVPYSFRDGTQCFSYSRCVDTGFEAAMTSTAPVGWEENAKFLSMDIIGSGSATDVVQIFSRDSQTVLRNYIGVGVNETLSSTDVVTRIFEDIDPSQTIQWCQIQDSRNPIQYLVRVWAEEAFGGFQFKTTAFALATPGNASSGLQEGRTCSIGPTKSQRDAHRHVLVCDINGDGVQDIVVASVSFDSSVSFGAQAVLTYDVMMGDGMGGFFWLDEVSRSIQVPSPAALSVDEDPGSFYMTNDGTGLYPSISYVYQAESKQYVSLTATGLASGLVSGVSQSTFGTDLPADSMRVLSADINASNISDWLLYSVDNGNATIVPAYSLARRAGLLEGIRDPMGLQTTFSYSPMSDPKVYRVKDDATDPSLLLGSYGLEGSPNLVVSCIQQENDATINGLTYSRTLTKCYYNARINYLGRGSMGFASVDTIDSSLALLLTEKYFQYWPLQGVRSEAVTQTLGAEPRKSEQFTYEHPVTRQGSWNIYSVRLQTSRVTTTDGEGLRSLMTNLVYDDRGNLIEQASFEPMATSPLSAVYVKKNYITIGGAEFLSAMKITTASENQDFTKYEDGDCALKTYDHLLDKAIVSGLNEWRDDLGQFVGTQYTFDDYGKEVTVVTPSGLTRTTVYDGIFHNFALQTTEATHDVTDISMAAYSACSGLEVAHVYSTGRVDCQLPDDFGRITQVYLNVVNDRPGLVLANKLLESTMLVGSASINGVLAKTSMACQRSITYAQSTSPSGATYMTSSTISYADSVVSAQHSMLDYVDCMQRVRARASQDGGVAPLTWQFSSFDTRGCSTFKSFPTINATIDIVSAAESLPGTKTTYDLLGRQITNVAPSPSGHGSVLVTRYDYQAGGARVQQTIYSAPDASRINQAGQISSSQRQYLRINGEDRVVASVDQNGLRSQFEHDALGRLIRSVSPDGKEQLQTRNTQGDIVRMKDDSQEYLYKYDSAGFLTERSSAKTATVVTYVRDATGRLMQKLGSDGRATTYTYMATSPRSFATATISQVGSLNPFESRLDFFYDQRGRVAERALTLGTGDSDPFITTYSYDWLDRQTSKTMPDGAMLEHSFLGSTLQQATLTGGRKGPWSMQAQASDYNAFRRPLRIDIQGTDCDPFAHEYEYDVLGFPQVHTLTLEAESAKTLVQESYFYNDLGQMSAKYEMVTGTTIDYFYTGLRLTSSQGRGGSVDQYSYSAGGDLVEKQGCQISYTAQQITGTGGGTPFHILYNADGQVAKRTVGDDEMTFSYDSYGSLQKYETQSGATTEMLNDHNGELLKRMNSDGSWDLFVDREFTVHVRADGSKTSSHKLFSSEQVDGSQVLLASVTTEFQHASSTFPLQGGRSAGVYFSDTKGSVTSRFKGRGANLQEQRSFDDFGVTQSSINNLDQDADLDGDMPQNVYEGKVQDVSGLINFNARWYDPLVGRFLTPDNIIEKDHLMRPDGLNRYAFENNDPINHIDPTGHWTLSSILGLVVSVVLVVAAVALTAVTAGAAGPLLGAVIGALAAGGLAGMQYSINHQDETDPGRFWAGFGLNVALNAAVGGISGGAGAAFNPGMAEELFSQVVSVGIQATVGAVSAMAVTSINHLTDNTIYGKNESYTDGLLTSAATGFITAGAAGVWAATRDPLMNVPTEEEMISSQLKKTAVAVLKPGLAMSWFEYKELNVTRQSAADLVTAAGSSTLANMSSHLPMTWMMAPAAIAFAGGAITSQQ